MKSRPLYDKCEICEGTCYLPLSQEGAPAVKCEFCKNGFNEIGLTEGQLRGILLERDQLLSIIQEYLDLTQFPAAPNEERLSVMRADMVALVSTKRGHIEDFRMRQKAHK